MFGGFSFGQGYFGDSPILDFSHDTGAGAGPDKKRRRADESLAEDDAEVLQVIQQFLATLDR